MSLSAICFIAILWLTLSPDPTGGLPVPIFPGADKIIHGIMFGGQTLCICVDLRRRDFNRIVSPAWIAAAIVFSSIFGIIIEYAQSAMELGRGFEVADMISDAAGTFLFAIAWRFWLEKLL